MRTVVIFAGLVVVLGAALWLAGVFESDPAADDVGTSDTTTDDTGTAGLGGDPGVKASAPQERPPLVAAAFPDTTRVLLVGAVPNTADEFMLQILEAHKNVAFHNWYLNPVGPRTPPKGKDLPKLDSMPDGPLLDQNDYTIVVISNVNPVDLPEDFWETLKKRVVAGQTHVLWRAWPPYPGGSPDSPPLEHPWFKHNVIASMLPVTKSLPFQGVTDESGQTHVPGMFGESGRRFVPTEAGLTHRATRLVDWPDWSQVWWDELSAGERRLAAKFCVPVSELAKDAVSLLGVDLKDADDIPAVVVGNVGDGRVLWLGTRELAWNTHHHAEYKARHGAVLNGMLAWLAGAE